jgi:hypothetical protein
MMPVPWRCGSLAGERWGGRGVLPTRQYNPRIPPTTRFSVRLDSMLLQTIRLRLREPFRISSGVTHERRILLVRLRFDGVEGIGECVAGETPDYSPETVETATLVIRRHLAGAVLGGKYPDPGAVAGRLERAARGHLMAKAAIEMAAWDAFARHKGVSLAGLLGGRASRVPAGVSLGIQEDIARLIDRVEMYLDQGYRRIKLKIAPGRDHTTLDAVRPGSPTWRSRWTPMPPTDRTTWTGWGRWTHTASTTWSSPSSPTPSSSTPGSRSGSRPRYAWTRASRACSGAGRHWSSARAGW